MAVGVCAGVWLWVSAWCAGAWAFVCVGLGAAFLCDSLFLFLFQKFKKVSKSLQSFKNKLPKTPGGVFSFQF